MESRSPVSVGHDPLWVKLKKLGEGTFGVVDLVENLRPAWGLFAVKSSPSPSSSIVKEYKILRTLFGSPNVIKCHDYFLNGKDGVEYDSLLLEYAPGGTLLDLIHKSGGKIPEHDVRRYTKMILEGLHYIHSRGYVHCDIKPENILVCTSELDKSSNSISLKLADFGQAKEPGDLDIMPPRQAFRGTPLYMSPESVKNGEITPALDIWSLGCVVVEMMTGEAPWESDVDGLEDLAIKICDTRDIPDIPKDMSRLGKDFLKKCFARDPRQRSTANELLKHPFVFTGEFPLMAAAPPRNEILLPHEFKLKLGLA